MEPLITWLANLLSQWRWWPFPPLTSAAWIVWLVYAAIIAFVIAPMAMIVLTWLERKILARIQDRIGPNRAGPFGVFQAIADAIKMLTKEDLTPEGADKIPFNIAPGLAALAAILVFAVLPVAPGVVGVDLNIGVFYIMAVGAYGIIAVLMAGWSSNNKYSLLGAFRAVAQLVAYEVPLALALITVTLVAGSMSTTAIVDGQQSGWYFIAIPLTFFIFFVSNMAEINRSPFDLLEAESELVAGFHIEYSAFKYALFMIGEYVHMLAAASFGAVFFLGGWRGPFIDWAIQTSPLLGAALGLIYFLMKVGFMIFVLMWIRGTLPRFRIDHLLDFGWKFLTPLALLNLMVVAFVVKLFQPAVAEVGLDAGLLRPWYLGGWGQTLGLLLASILVVIVASAVVKGFAHRSKEAGLRAIAAVE